MRKLIVANWKMHFNPTEASMLLHQLNAKISSHPDVEIVLCPPFIDLYPLVKEIDQAKFKLGSQNLHYLDEGAFTGEVSAAMLQGLVNYAIIGHSERRQMGEDDKVIAKKVAASLRHRIAPILCVGENLLDREHGGARKVVTDQITADLSQITADELPQMVICYEPVWAISQGNGHGHYAKPDEVTGQIKAIHQTLTELFGAEAVEQVRLLYGGSVNPDNVQAYMEIPEIGGLLVGGASLNYAEFSALVAATQAVAHV